MKFIYATVLPLALIISFQNCSGDTKNIEANQSYQESWSETRPFESISKLITKDLLGYNRVLTLQIDHTRKKITGELSSAGAVIPICEKYTDSYEALRDSLAQMYFDHTPGPSLRAEFYTRVAEVHFNDGRVEPIDAGIAQDIRPVEAYQELVRLLRYTADCAP